MADDMYGGDLPEDGLNEELDADGVAVAPSDAAHRQYEEAQSVKATRYTTLPRPPPVERVARAPVQKVASGAGIWHRAVSLCWESGGACWFEHEIVEGSWGVSVLLEGGRV